MQQPTLTRRNQIVKSGHFNNYYKKGRLLGTGAFAEVFECTRLMNQKKYAVKIIKKTVSIPDFTGSTNFQKPTAKNSSKNNSFDTELSINLRLNHQNIVNLIEVYKTPVFHLVFDLCKGGDLFDDIERRSIYSEHDATICITQILQGTAYIHSQNVIHRDLKPENLLLTNENIIKIADFGLAVEVDPTGPNNGQAWGIAGSPDYIAPEILNKQKYTSKVDSWSCGVILYILLCGYPPFANPKEIKEGKVLFYVEDWSHILKEARTLIVQLLNVDPEKRFTCQQALSSFWIIHNQMKADKNSKHLGKTLTEIRKFNAKRKFKGTAKAIMSTARLSKLGQLAGAMKGLEVRDVSVDHSVDDQ